MPKSKQQNRHFKRRLKERFSLSLNQEQHRRLIQKVQAGEGKFVERQSLRVTVWLIELDGVQIKVVYDKNTKELVTAMYVEKPQ